MRGTGDKREGGKIHLFSPQKHPTMGDLCAKHNGRVCAPQTDGAAQANVLLAFRRDLF